MILWVFNIFGRGVEKKYSKKFRYWFDGFMAKGSSSAFAALTIVFLIAFVFIGLLRWLAVSVFEIGPVERGEGGWRQVFLTFLELTDSGSITQDIDSSSAVKFFAVIASLVGIVLFSALIAFITTALDQKLKDLRKGHSRVIEVEHSLILGWNDRIVDILKELILANESESSQTIVILADRDKEEMDDFLNLNVPIRKTTKIVTRSGVPSSLINLDVASANTARSVIILSQASPGDSKTGLARSDMAVIKSLLALRKLLDSNIEIPVVAEIYSEQHRQVAQKLGINRVVCLDAQDILAKILVQTSRSEGLAVVYEEMLSFDGAEIYLYPLPVFGVLFGHLGMHIPDGVPMGVVRSDSEVLINPGNDLVLVEGDIAIILASDDSSITVSPKPLFQPSAWNIPNRKKRSIAEHELVIGWTPKFENLIREYSDYVVAGSSIDVVLREPDPSKQQEALALSNECGLNVRVTDCDPFNPDELEQLQPGNYDNVIILSDADSSEKESAEWADAETLLMLIQLQHILADSPKPHPALIAEVLDSKNRELFSQAGISEFVISNSLVSMLSAQMSEDANLFDVYKNLFSEDGSEVYLKPMFLYFEQLPNTLRFCDLMIAAQQRGEIALGVRISSADKGVESNFGVQLIPDKNSSYQFSADDYLVVLAEDET